MRLWLLPICLAACTPLPELPSVGGVADAPPALLPIEALRGEVTEPADPEEAARLQSRAQSLQARADRLRAAG